MDDLLEFPRCTHPTGRHTLKVKEDTKPLGPTIECVECGANFYLLSEQQVEYIKQRDKRFNFIPPIQHN